MGSGFPITAASATAWCETSALSTSAGPDVVARDDDDVIGPADHHDVPVSTFDREIPRRVHVRDRLPVLPVALVVFVDRAHHGRPGIFDREKTSLCPAETGMPSLFTTSAFDPADRFSHKTGPHRFADHGGDHLHTGLGLPPGIHDRAPVLSDSRGKYHSNASGLSGSPTDPMIRREERLYLSGQTSPTLMNVRIAVGAV